MQIDKKMTDYLRGKKRAVMLDPEFPKEDFQVAKKKQIKANLKSCSILLVIRDVQIKTRMRYLLHTHQND